MKMVKDFGRLVVGALLVCLGVALLVCSLLAPNVVQASNVLTYSAVALVFLTGSVIVTVAPRLSTLHRARLSGNATIFDRAFANFKEYCVKSVADCSHISRLLMYIFTVLIIAALVVKGSVAIAVLLTVCFAVAAGLKGLIRAVASGKATSSDLFVAV